MRFRGSTPANLVLLATLCAGQAGAESDPDSVWSGVYSHAQAVRGQASYGMECSGCHQSDLSGVGGVLVGQRFLEHWSEDQLGNFFHRVKTTMPPRAKAGLSDSTYLDIVSFVLQSNGFPAGEHELTLAGLDKIRIEGKDGPQEVPEFALVRSIGCLKHGAEGEWTLDHASPAARTREPGVSPAAEAAASAKLSGTGVFHFLNTMPSDIAELKLEQFKDHKVEAKGLLIRKPGMEVLNLTSVSSVAAACP